jgi:hypothetical protein
MSLYDDDPLTIWCWLCSKPFGPDQPSHSFWNGPGGQLRYLCSDCALLVHLRQRDPE